MEETYSQTKARWLGGERERELALQLMYLAWMHWADPPFVTGLSDDADALSLWLQIFGFFGAEESSDSEFLYVAAIMVHLTPWVLGDERDWQARAERLRLRSMELRPQGFGPESFHGRGEYGDYFAHQSRRDRSEGERLEH